MQIWNVQGVNCRTFKVLKFSFPSFWNINCWHLRAVLLNIYLKSGVSKWWPMSRWWSVLVGKVLLEHGCTRCLCIVYRCFCTTSAEWSSCDRDRMVYKVPALGWRRCLVQGYPFQRQPPVKKTEWEKRPTGHGVRRGEGRKPLCWVLYTLIAALLYSGLIRKEMFLQQPLESMCTCNQLKVTHFFLVIDENFFLSQTWWV